MQSTIQQAVDAQQAELARRAAAERAVSEYANEVYERAVQAANEASRTSGPASDGDEGMKTSDEALEESMSEEGDHDTGARDSSD